MNTILLYLSVSVLVIAFVSIILKLIKKFTGTRINNIPIIFTTIIFLATAYILFYFKFFKQAYVVDFIATMEKLLQIMLIFIAIIVFLYMLIGFFGRRYTLRVDKFNIGGINILFDQSNEIFIKTVGTFIAAKRTLFKFNESRDNIYEVLDAYYLTYKFIRDNLELLDPERDEEIYQVSVNILKKINNFLTNHQNDFRRWYDKTKADDKIIISEDETIIFHSTTIEEVQKHYYRYDEIIEDIIGINTFMKDAGVKEIFNIKGFNWEE